MTLSICVYEERCVLEDLLLECGRTLVMHTVYCDARAAILGHGDGEDADGCGDGHGDGVSGIGDGDGHGSGAIQTGMFNGAGDGEFVAGERE